VADRLRRAVPQVEARLTTRAEGAVTIVELVLENLGFLPTSALAHAEGIRVARRAHATLRVGEGMRVVSGEIVRDLGHLDGWGNAQVAGARTPLYPSLPERGHRASARWVVEGAGELSVRWEAGRGGAGVVRAVV
jgi:hypothetical protein